MSSTPWHTRRHTRQLNNVQATARQLPVILDPDEEHLRRVAPVGDKHWAVPGDLRGAVGVLVELAAGNKW